MAETIRSPSSILSLFADNTSGDISAQDLRDFVETVRMQQGFIHVQQGFNGAEGTTGGSQALVDVGLYSTLGLRNFSAGTGMALQYDGPGSVGPCLVLNWGSIKGDSASIGTVTLQNRLNWTTTVSGTAADGGLDMDFEADIDNVRLYPYFFLSYFSSISNSDEISQVYTASGTNPTFSPNAMACFILWGN